MKRIILVTLMLAAMFWAYRIHDRHNFSYHEKLTLAFSTPNGPIEASAVIQRDAWRSYLNIANTGGNYWDRHGEALVADLGQGRYLFVPISERPKLVEVMYEQGLAYGSIELKSQNALRAQTSPVVLTPEQMPKMAYFPDLADPTSIVSVDPDNLTAVMGEGFTLTRATLQTTDDPVTEGRTKPLLEWLGVYTKRLDVTYSDGRSRTYSSTHFDTDIYDDES